MGTTERNRFAARTRSRSTGGIALGVVALLFTLLGLADPAGAADLKVMRTGLGSGTVTSATPGISCGLDCDETYGSAVAVTLTATPDAGSTFSGWAGDCSGTGSCVVTMSADRSLRAEFSLSTAIPTLGDFTPEGVDAYLTANPAVDSPARFIRALPDEFKWNWILMSRSESLQTGTAETPRILLPSEDARFTFSAGLATHPSYPGAHPNAIEYMQWDATDKNFRFHEVVLAAIPAMGVFPARSRGVSIDDLKCSRCHSTQNVLNTTSSPGTTGIPPGTLKAKNKPNWDSYDSWAGMMPFNRDRIYKGSVEAATFRRIFNLWTWRDDEEVRSVIEQLELQPPVFGVPPEHIITRIEGGTYDGYIEFGFDESSPILIEPAPVGASTILTNYEFDGALGTGPSTPVERGGPLATPHLVTLHHSDIPGSDEGRGVHFFDLLGGLFGDLNPQRIADELIDHRFATGSFPIDVRPIALAITKSCLSRDEPSNTVTSTPPLTIDLTFFDARNGMQINELVDDTRLRAESMPRRKADFEKVNVDRTGDPYLVAPTNGLVQQDGDATDAGMDTSLERLRQEVFRRPIDFGAPDSTVMLGIYVDRESYAFNLERVALYRYFLEPLGVSVDSWSMGVRGRSRTYTFADVFSAYLNVFEPELQASLISDPVPGLTDPDDCAQLIDAVNLTLASLPPAGATPTYTDVQRIFNRSCIECHGGLDYPPYSRFGSTLDLSEDELLTLGTRLARSHERATDRVTGDPATSPLYLRITRTTEDCPFGLMPCGGPPLSKVDIETIRRWIVGGSPSTAGDPHVKTVDGVNYDFQAAGEFVLLRGENLEVQARQTAVATHAPLGPNPHTGLTSCVSVNGAVAVRIGPHRITYQPAPGNPPNPGGLQLRIDGELTALPAPEILLPSGGRIVRTSASGGIQIEAPGGTVVVITPGWWSYYEIWYINLNVRHARAIHGVMGALAPASWLPALPNGSSLGPRPADLHQRYKDLYAVFGDAWRVTGATSLFDYAPYTSTESFTIESWPGESPESCTPPPLPSGPLDRPPLDPLPMQMAEQHCQAIVTPDRKANCVQDVMVTADPGFATTYLATEKIERNTPPFPPILVYPKDNQVDVTTQVSFTWQQATDPDGDPLAHRLCVWGVQEPFTFAACQAASGENAPWGGVGAVNETVVNVAPGGAYFWKVIADDGNGGSTESETRRFET